jgi:pilus assembly protein Flp/PilA
MLRFFRKLRKDESGATAIEYGLIAGLISVVIIGVVMTTGNELVEVFTAISSALQDASAGGAAPAP